MSGLNRWASAGLVTVGAGCLVGVYTLLYHGTPAAAQTRLIQPITVVASPAPVTARGARPDLRPKGVPAGIATDVNAQGYAQAHLTAQDWVKAFDDPSSSDSEEADADDGDGIEPANLAGRSMTIASQTPAGQVLTEAPEAAWMRRLVVARELLREGGVESGRQTLERIIGEAPVCRAYQYALVDLAAVELQRGQAGSAQQLLDEARGSNRSIAFDNLTRSRVVNLQVAIQIHTQAMTEAAPIERQ